MKNKLEAEWMVTVGSDPAAPFEASQDASAGVKPEIENVCAESECSSATPADDPLLLFSSTFFQSSVSLARSSSQVDY